MPFFGITTNVNEAFSGIDEIEIINDQTKLA